MTTDREPLIQRLGELTANNNRAALATLRRSLSFPPGTWPGAFRYIESVPRLGSGWGRQVAYLIAGLYALARGKEGSGDFGNAARRFQGTTDSKSVERRFISIIEADADELPHRLRQMMTLLSSEGIVPDWNQLYVELRQWNHPEKYIQQRWASSFYAPKPRASQENRDEKED